MAFPPYISDTNEGVTEYQLTSWPELQRLLSSYGVALHTSDVDEASEDYDEDNPGEVSLPEVQAEWVQRASSHVMSFLAPRYLAKTIYKIPRIREIATYWLAYKITRRRGNEPLFVDEVVEAEDELREYRMGTRYLDAPSNGPRATLQSYHIDNRSFRYPSRVVTQASTQTISGQQINYQYPFFWL